MEKYVKHLTDRQLMERLADDLVEMHRGTYIDLAAWETGRELVERYYQVVVDVKIYDKNNKKFSEME
jgi:hypothetical protein